jgi:hypothetical protein
MLTARGEIEGEVKEISLSGALIYCQKPPHPSEEILRLSIEIPQSNYTLLATAQVEGLEIYDSDSDNPYYGVRVHFLNIRACPIEEVSLPDNTDNRSKENL